MLEIGIIVLKLLVIASQVSSYLTEGGSLYRPNLWIKILCRLSQEIISSLIEPRLQPHPSRLLVIKLTADIVADVWILLGHKAIHLLLLKGQTQNIQKPAVAKGKVLGLVLDFSMQIFVNQIFETQNSLFLIQLPKIKAHIFTKIEKILLQAG